MMMIMIYKNNKGSTLIEMVSVLILIGIVSAVTIMGSVFNSTKTRISETDKIKSHLCYTRLMSLSDDEYSWRITFSSNPPTSPVAPLDSSYPPTPYRYYYLSKIKKDDGTETKTKFPDVQVYDNILELKLDSGKVTFNEWGVPVDAAGVPLTTDQEIKLTDGTKLIVIKKDTGFIL